MADTPRQSPRRPTRRLRAFARAKDGATAVEFALVAAPFTLLVFAIIELGLVSLVSISLDNALIDTGRQIRTGEMQTAGATAATFKAAVCGQLSWLGSRCASDLTLDVRTVSSFSSSNALTTPATPCWDAGGPGSIVVVRAYYTWLLITPMLQTGLQTANGKRIINATTAFANEPYSDTPAVSVTCPA